MTREPCIVAVGGGGFSDDRDGPLMDYLLSLAEKDEPRICFVPTASGDADSSIVTFYTQLNQKRCRPNHLAIYRHIPDDMESFICSQDIVFVGGGNTANLLAVWRLHGLDHIFEKAWRSGVILCGSSAGGNCWFEQSVTDSFGNELRPQPLSRIPPAKLLSAL